MSKIKHLGKFTDEGDYINLPFQFEKGKYRVEIKPSGETKRDKTIHVDENGIMKLPNYNGRKTFAPGSNIFHIYKIINGQRERIWFDGYSRFSLFLKAKSITDNSIIECLIYADNNGNHYLSYLKNGDLHIDLCNPDDYENKLIIQYPFSL